MPVNTPCRDCVFAHYHGNTQDGCTLGRLETFRKQSVDIVEAHDGQGKEFYVVYGRVCLAMRKADSDWTKKYPPAEQAAQVRKEVALRLDVIVPIHNEEDSIEDVLKTVASLERQRIEPLRVWVVINKQSVQPAETLRLVDELGKTGLDYRIKRIVEKGPKGQAVTVLRAIDLTVADTEGTYYALVLPGVELPADFIESIDEALNDHNRLERFSLLRGSRVATVVQTALHRALGGNGEMAWTNAAGENRHASTIVDKIILTARDENLPHMIRRAEEVCLSLQ